MHNNRNRWLGFVVILGIAIQRPDDPFDRERNVEVSLWLRPNRIRRPAV